MTRNWLISIILIAIIILASSCQQGAEVDSNQVSETEDDNQTNAGIKDNENNPQPQTDTEETKALENEAFKIFLPVPNEKVNGHFILKGKARVFEATFQYKLEDDQHNILAEGFITADKGAPEWGDFEVDIPFKDTTRANAILTVFEESANDGSPQHELSIPLKIENKETTISENEAFKIITPAPNQKVNEHFILKGKARVFEAAFQYKLEDGQHNVLAEGFITASKGAPEWGDFEMDISYKETTSPNAILTVFEASPKDGSPQHELFIPLKIGNDN